MFGPLLTDLYQLTMLQAYFDRGMDRPASFEFFVRKLPGRRNFLMAAGLDHVLQFLERLRFEPAEIAWLANRPLQRHFPGVPARVPVCR